MEGKNRAKLLQDQLDPIFQMLSGFHIFIFLLFAHFSLYISHLVSQPFCFFVFEIIIRKIYFIFWNIWPLAALGWQCPQWPGFQKKEKIVSLSESTYITIKYFDCSDCWPIILSRGIEYSGQAESCTNYFGKHMKGPHHFQVYKNFMTQWPSTLGKS